jgi:hypothetical protein
LSLVTFSILVGIPYNILKEICETRELLVLLESARTKLALKQGDVSRLTKKEISDILLAYY